MKIAITGGTGFLGRKLTDYFLAKGHKVIIITRRESKDSKVETYRWDVEKKFMPEETRRELYSSDAVIHLAGANIAERRWTEEYKKIIVESRVRSTEFLCDVLNESADSVPKTVVFASATGYYGSRNEKLDENSPHGNGFLAETCVLWEKASEGLRKDIRKNTIRIGFVMDRKEGGFPRMILPVKFFAGAIPGSGKQYISWIHVHDLIRMFDFLIEKESSQGVYNGVSPRPVTLEEMLRKSASYLGRPIFLPNIPEFLIEMILGEMSQLVLQSAEVYPERIMKEGFQFQFPEIDSALKDLLT